jgi:hypothetical protein
MGHHGTYYFQMNNKRSYMENSREMNQKYKKYYMRSLNNVIPNIIMTDYLKRNNDEMAIAQKKHTGPYCCLCCVEGRE